MDGRKTWPGFEYVDVFEATEKHPRNDSASIVEFENGDLFIVWIQMHRSELEGHDEAPSSIASMRSYDSGRTWSDYRIEVSPQENELSVYNPSLIVLPDGELLFFYLTYHCLDYDKPLSSSGFTKRSSDNGQSWTEPTILWKESTYGCANDTFTLLSDGRLLKSVEDVPYRGASPGAPGHRSGCFSSDDYGKNWTHPADWVVLPLRGCMENHIAETNDSALVMAMRTQLGSVYLARSDDRGEHWTHPQISGVTAPESMPSLTRIPSTGHLLLIWNHAQYDHRYNHSGKRTPLTCAVSKDGGRSFEHIQDIEDAGNAEFSNIGCTYTKSGEVIVTYFTSEMIDPEFPGKFRSPSNVFESRDFSRWEVVRMNRNRTVHEVIKHRETRKCPYTLDFEVDSAIEGLLDEHYGSDSWRNRYRNYIVKTPAMPDGRDVWKPGPAYRTDFFGTTWRLDLKPVHVETPAMIDPDLSKYTFPDVSRFATPDWQDGVRKFARDNEDRFIVVYTGFGLFERSWMLRGFEQALTDSAIDPDFYQSLITAIAEQHFEPLLDILVTLPVDGIMFGDDWGDQRNVMIGPPRWRDVFKPQYRRLYDRVHKAGKVAINHVCGSVIEIIPDLIDIGLDVLESIQVEANGMNPYEIKTRYGSDIGLWGGLGSQSLIPFGKPEELRSEIRRLAEEMSVDGGYILSCAKALQAGTPVENASVIFEEFIRAGKES